MEMSKDGQIIAMLGKWEKIVMGATLSDLWLAQTKLGDTIMHPDSGLTHEIHKASSILHMYELLMRFKLYSVSHKNVRSIFEMS